METLRQSPSQGNVKYLITAVLSLYYHSVLSCTTDPRLACFPCQCRCNLDRAVLQLIALDIYSYAKHPRLLLCTHEVINILKHNKMCPCWAFDPGHSASQVEPALQTSVSWVCTACTTILCVPAVQKHHQCSTTVCSIFAKMLFCHAD